MQAAQCTVYKNDRDYGTLCLEKKKGTKCQIDAELQCKFRGSKCFQLMARHCVVNDEIESIDAV